MARQPDSLKGSPWGPQKAAASSMSSGVKMAPSRYSIMSCWSPKNTVPSYRPPRDSR